MKRFAPAAGRNQAAITEVLGEFLPASGLVLEVASGTGQHIAHFASAFPQLQWQPSDIDSKALASIAAWVDEAALPNLYPPLSLNVSTPGEGADFAPWPVDRAAAIININMLHISPWTACLGLLAGAARILDPGGLLYLYGPYRQRDRATAPSNEAFDESLRGYNPAWGLRLLEDVIAVAEERGLAFTHTRAMPANNISAIFRKRLPNILSDTAMQ